MKLAQIHIEGYRCFDEVDLDVNDLTVLLGSNSTGKSSLLKALHFVFEDVPASREDVMSDGREPYFAVRVTFEDLSSTDRAVLGPYGQADRLVLTKSWSDGEVSLTGRSLKAELFDPIRALRDGNERKAAYRQLRNDRPDLALPDTNRVAEADQALLTWEMEHPDECETREEEASRFFGFPAVGKGVLASRFKFVFVPGLRDAAKEAAEGRGTLLQQLLSAIAEQRTEADAGLQALEERTRAEYAELVEQAHAPTLSGLSAKLRDQMRRYVPTAEVRLDAVAPQFSIGSPMILLRGGEERHLTDLSRQGHGFQRTFIIAALEYLAQVSAEEEQSNDRPVLFLGIEEPELYQHPPRARHFANTLRALAAPDGLVQVCYATHSSYFIEPADFASVRLCRRTRVTPDTPLVGHVAQADVEGIESRVAEQYRGRVAEYLARTLSSRFREAFFAKAVLLVEGATDIAVFEQLGRMLGRDLLANGVVCADVSKTVLPLAYIVLTSLDLPVFVVFDGDSHLTDQETCDVCGRGDKDRRTEAARRNRAILDCLGATIVDFPPDTFDTSWAAFSTDIEHYLRENVEGFDERSLEITAEMGWKRKSPEVHAETLERLGSSAVPEELNGVVERLLALAAGSTGGDGHSADPSHAEEGASSSP